MVFHGEWYKLNFPFIVCRFDFRSYEAGQDQKRKNKLNGDNGSGGNRKESPGKKLKWYENVMRRAERAKRLRHREGRHGPPPPPEDFLPAEEVNRKQIFSNYLCR